MSHIFDAAPILETRTNPDQTFRVVGVQNEQLNPVAPRLVVDVGTIYTTGGHPRGSDVPINYVTSVTIRDYDGGNPVTLTERPTFANITDGSGAQTLSRARFSFAYPSGQFSFRGIARLTLNLANGNTFEVTVDFEPQGADSEDYMILFGTLPGGYGGAVLGVPSLTPIPLSVSETAPLNREIGVGATPSGFPPEHSSVETFWSFADGLGGSSLTSGPFTIADITGDIRVSGILDYETQSSYTLLVSYSRGGITLTAETIVSIINEGIFLTGNTYTITENTQIGTAIGIAAFANDFPSGTPSWSFADGGLTSGPFTINASTGILSVSGVLDFEFQPRHSLSISFSQGGQTRTATAVVILADVSETGYSPNVPTLPRSTQSPNVELYLAGFENSTRGGVSFTRRGLSILVGATENVVIEEDYISGMTLRNEEGRIIASLGDLNKSLVDYSSVDDNVVGFRWRNTNENIIVGTLGELGTAILTISFGDDSNATGRLLTYRVVMIPHESTGDTDSLVEQYQAGQDNSLIGSATQLPPTLLPTSDLSVNEHVPTGTVIGTAATATNFPSGNPGWSLTQPATPVPIAINGANGQLTTTGPIDFETTESYTFTVTLTQGGETASTTVTVAVNDQADASLVPATGLSVAERSEVGTVIGVAATPMNFPAGTPAWRFGNGTTSSFLFSINADNGQLFLNAVPDYEALSQNNRDNGFTRSVVLEQGGQTATVNVNIRITDVDDDPRLIPNASLSINENVATGTTVGQAATPMFFPGGTATWTLVQPTTPVPFAINASSGVLTTSGLIDYEAATAHTFTVMLSQGGSTASTSVTVSVNNVVESLTATAGLSVAENSSNGTVVGTAATAQNFPPGTAQWSFVGGSLTSGPFTINASNGQLTVSGALDFETQASYTLQVQLSQGGTTLSAAVAVSVTDVDEPTLTATTGLSVAENSAIGTTVGNAGTVEHFPSGTPAWSFSDGTLASGPFAINASTGAITTTAELDFETTPSYSLGIQFAQGGTTLTATLTIAVTDTGEPVLTPTIGLSIAENAAQNSVVGTAATPMNFPTGTGAWSFSDSTLVSGPFTISASNGQLTLTGSIDFETTSSYSLMVSYTLGGITRTATVAVSITDAPEPRLMAISNLSVRDGAMTGTVIGMVAMPMDFPAGNPAWSFEGGSLTSGPFTIDASTGSVSTSGTIDFDTTESYTLSVTFSQGGQTLTVMVTIAVMQASITELVPGGPFSVTENEPFQPESLGVAAAPINFPDGDGVWGFLEDDKNMSLDQGNGVDLWVFRDDDGIPHSSLFLINRSTGELSTFTGADFEGRSTWAVPVVYTQGGVTRGASVAVNVIDIDDIAAIIDGATSFYNSDTPPAHHAPEDDREVLFVAFSEGSDEIVFHKPRLPSEASSPFPDNYVTRFRFTDGRGENERIFDTASATIRKTQFILSSFISDIITYDYNAATLFPFSAWTSGSGIGGQGSILGIMEVTFYDSTVFSYSLFARSFDITAAQSIYERRGSNTGSAIVVSSPAVANPMLIPATDLMVQENSANGTVVGTAAMAMNFPSGDPAWAFGDGTGTGSLTSGPFTIAASTGQITVSGAIDFETQVSYSLQVQLTQGGSTATTMVTIIVEDVDDIPRLVIPENVMFGEHAESPTLSVAIRANNFPGDGDIVWTVNGAVLPSGMGSFAPAFETFVFDDSVFVFTGPFDGVSPRTAFDFETGPTTYTIEIQASRGGVTRTGNLVLTLVDVDESMIIPAGHAPITVVETGSTFLTLSTMLREGEPSTATVTYDWYLGTTTASIITSPIATMFDHPATVTFTGLSPNTTYRIGARLRVNGEATLRGGDFLTTQTRSAQILPAVGLSVPENSDAGTVVGIAALLDGVSPDNLAWSFSGGALVSGPFTINASTGQLTVSGAIDFETQSSYTLSIAIRDTVASIDYAVDSVVVVADVQEEFVTPATGLNVDEHVATGTVVGIAGTPMDFPDGDPAWAFANGTTSSPPFAINATTGQITTAAAIDYETAQSYTLSVRFTQGGRSVSFDVVIAINNLTERLVPTVGLNVNEHVPAFTVVGVAGTPENFPPGTASWSFASGSTSSPPFIISSSNGTISTSGVIDYETAQSYTLSVRYSRGGESRTASVTIAINNLIEALVPTAGLNVDENRAAGTVVGIAGTVQNFPSGSPAWSFSNGTLISTPFAINATTGQLTTTAVLDYETATSYTVSVRVTQGGESRSADVTIAVNNLSETLTPTVGLNVDENQAIGTVVGLAGTAQNFPAGSPSWSFSDGTLASPPFAINATSGQLTTTAVLDYEVAQSYTLSVRFSQGGETRTVDVGIAVNNLAETLTPTAGLSVTENAQVGTVVGIAAIAANFPPGNPTWAFVDGSLTSGPFTISASTGRLAVSGAIDFEVQTSYLLGVRFTQGGLTLTANVMVAVSNVLETTLTATTGLMIAEGSDIGTVVGIAATFTEFPAGVGAWSFGDGTLVSDPFRIDAATGQITTTAAIDFETQQSYVLTVRFSRGGTTLSTNISIAVLNVDDSPTLVPIAGLNVDENVPFSTVVGVAATARNFPSGLSIWSFTNGTTSSPPFSINPNTGIISTSGVVDFEVSSSYTVGVQLTQGGVTRTANVTILVNDLVDPVAPPVISESISPTVHYMAWIVSLPNASPPLRFWTGTGDLIVDGNTYNGFGTLVSIGELNNELSQPVNQMTIQMSLVPFEMTIKRLFLRDPGPLQVEVSQVYSSDGANWLRIPRTFRGRLSAPRLTNDVYQIDVVTRVADVDRGRPIFWSSEYQRFRYPGDASLDYMRDFAGGVDIRWPA